MKLILFLSACLMGPVCLAMETESVCRQRKSPESSIACQLCHEDIKYDKGDATGYFNVPLIMGACVQEHGKSFHKACLHQKLKSGQTTKCLHEGCTEKLCYFDQDPYSCEICKDKVVLSDSAYVQTKINNFNFMGTCILKGFHGLRYHALCLRNHVDEQLKENDTAHCGICKSRITFGSYSAVPTMEKICRNTVIPCCSGMASSVVTCTSPLNFGEQLCILSGLSYSVGKANVSSESRANFNAGLLCGALASTIGNFCS